MCGIFRCIVKVSASAMIVSLLVPFAIFVIMYVISDTGLEWVDEDGRGNGYRHELKDVDGGHIMFFRLSNYDSFHVNGAYKFLLEGNCLTMKSEDKVDISIIKYSQKGDLLNHHKITDSLANAEISCFLPPSCSPKSEGEVLLIKVDVFKSRSTDPISQAASQSRFKEIRARLVCEKVRYFPAL